MTKKPKRPKKPAKKKQPYGIGEWFGHNYLLTSKVLRAALVLEAVKRYPKKLCRFRESFPAMAPRAKAGGPNLNCTKGGGVCCLQQHKEQEDGQKHYGPLITTCPVRFCQDGTVFAHIAHKVLGASYWRFAKEINFLNPDVAPALFLPPAEARAVAEEAQAVPSDAGTADFADVAVEENEGAQQSIDDDESARSVGRIDMVLAATNQAGTTTGDWCAVELQAVYFQGDSMTGEWDAISSQADSHDAPPGPVKNRRPDFRSSGPKRLLPQLQIKVPSLRRWGKKMAVVVDASFFSTFGPMKCAEHVSNADIIWCVVGYQPGLEAGLFELCVLGTCMVTLEEAVIGLTAGKPRTKPDFEASLNKRLETEAYQAFLNKCDT